MRIPIVHLAVLVLGASLSGVADAQVSAAPHAVPRTACGALTGLQVEAAVVASANLVEAGRFDPPAAPYAPDLGARAAKMPAFCRVQATATRAEPVTRRCR